MEQQRQWRRLNGKKIMQPISHEVKQAIEIESSLGHRIQVCVGTDSQVKAGRVEFATVIVFVRKGNGAFMFIHKETVTQKMNIKERMMQEVNRSIEVAYEIGPVLEAFNINVEVHADINSSESFKSNIALKDAAGYVSGMGFMFKAKPQAFASSSCANKIVQ
ncbi:MAG: hypothetical protein EOO13_04410 [Chitinophagaceae bacterium]|nr:MAG: hypothetical protein EOO13_04410 [Chitinophagaceae bacterium]